MASDANQVRTRWNVYWTDANVEPFHSIKFVIPASKRHISHLIWQGRTSRHAP